MAAKIYHIKRFAALLCLSTAFSQTACVAENNKNSDSGENLAQIESGQTADFSKKMSVAGEKDSKSTPKNIIVFIGDGMGVSTITAGRIFVGQEKGLMGEENELAFDTFPQLAMIKTYNVNAQVPDSAGTATAILSGYKTNIGAINVRPNQDISAMVAEGCGQDVLPTLTDKAKVVGKSAGVVTTARLTHATPAAMYAHTASRRIETDQDLKGPFAADGCKSISQQLIESDLDLAFGGGLKLFADAQLEAWPGVIATTKQDMMGAPRDQRLLAAFEGNEKAVVAGQEYDRHMNFESNRDTAVEPSIKEMTTTAMDRLSGNEDGYVLMVESGRIDHAHHGTNAYNALRDLQALDEAVAAAVAKADGDTLILVTADHSHVFTMAGYPVRGNPILGLMRENERNTGQPAEAYSLAKDGKPYTTLGYHNGPNVREAASAALTDNMVQAREYQQQTAIDLNVETHSGEDVVLHAIGPGAQRFNGVMEQNEIGQILAEFLSQ